MSAWVRAALRYASAEFVPCAWRASDACWAFAWAAMQPSTSRAEEKTPPAAMLKHVTVGHFQFSLPDFVSDVKKGDRGPLHRINAIVAENVSFSRVKEKFCETKLRFPSTPIGLVHSILDIMVDRYLMIVDELEDRLEKLQDALLDMRYANVPTVAEQGFKGFEAVDWKMVVAPANTPPDIVRKIYRDVSDILKQRDVADKLNQQGALPVGDTPEEFAQYIRDEIAKWGKVVRDANIKLD